MEFRKAVWEDLDEIERFYDEVSEYLEQHINYCGWEKGLYPNRDTAIAGVEENSLFVGCEGGRIAGSMILRHRPEEAYAEADWHISPDYSEIFVIYTFAVHPDFQQKGVGRQFMEFILSYAREQKMKAVRLDVYEENVPAIRLYESCGFEYIDTVDLGLGELCGLERFRLYQRIL